MSGVRISLITVASPHTRGWTCTRCGRCSADCGFPAHAGMDPGLCRPPETPHGLPRTRGDGPLDDIAANLPSVASPHTRGWTLLDYIESCRHDGFPAHAGMDRSGEACQNRQNGLPRTRGDGPRFTCRTANTPLASPHTRGWTARRQSGAPRRSGFPAHAGMDPLFARRQFQQTGLPRTRGDGPVLMHMTVKQHLASPHTRGWTAVAYGGGKWRDGFPAHAGMDLGVAVFHGVLIRLPRTRGDGP